MASKNKRFIGVNLTEVEYKRLAQSASKRGIGLSRYASQLLSEILGSHNVYFTTQDNATPVNGDTSDLAKRRKALKLV